VMMNLNGAKELVGSVMERLRLERLELEKDAAK
jgi:hypothetical protein